MILVSYLTENFIRETLKLGNNELRLFLQSLCNINENIFLVFEPNLTLKSIKKNPPKNITQTNLTLWGNYISYLGKLGRLKEYKFLKDYFESGNTYNNNIQKEFIQKSLKKIFYLSFKKFNIKKPYFELESLGDDIDQVKYKIDVILKNALKPTKNIKNLGDREELFFDKLGGFCCFYNTILWIDRYILDTSKKDPVIFLKTPSRLLNGSSIKNLIILTSDPYSEYPKRNHKDRKNCIESYIKNIYEAIYPNKVLVHLFVLMPEELKKIHSRFVSWMELPDSDEFDIKDLNNLRNQIKVSVQPDKGAGYFEEDSEYGFTAQFNYASKTVVNEHIIDLLESEPIKEYDSFEIWEKQGYPQDKVWIHHTDILKKLTLKK